MTMRDACLETHILRTVVNKSGHYDVIMIDPAGRRSRLWSIHRCHPAGSVLRRGVTLGSIYRMQNIRIRKGRKDGGLRKNLSDRPVRMPELRLRRAAYR